MRSPRPPEPARPRKVPASFALRAEALARSPALAQEKDAMLAKPRGRPRPPHPRKEELRGGRRPAEAHLSPAKSALGTALAVLPLGAAVLVARAALLRDALQTTRYSLIGADDWVSHRFGGSPGGFFVDIGAFPPGGFSNTRGLERSGWRGVCADPMPREAYRRRSCGFVPRPISNASGELVLPPGCVEAQLVDGGFLDTCTRAQATTLSVRELLHIADIPRVIDYISVSARGLGMRILEGFPWEAHCVRLWTVEVARDQPMAAEELALLRARGCLAAVKGPELFADCPCGGFAAAPTPGVAEEGGVGGSQEHSASTGAAVEAAPPGRPPAAGGSAPAVAGHADGSQPQQGEAEAAGRAGPLASTPRRVPRRWRPPGPRRRPTISRQLAVPQRVGKHAQ